MRRAARRRGRREPQVTELTLGEGHQRGAPQGDGGQPEGPAHGRGHRQARRRLPRDRRAAEGLRRAARHRLAARRVRDRGHVGRPRDPRLPPGRPRSSSTASSTPPSTSWSPRWPSSTPRSEGAITLSLVVRIPFGGGIGAVEHHSESPEAYFAHTAGLRVVSPSTPNDGYWMIRQAIDCADPVLFLEPKCRYWEKGEVDEAGPPSGLFSAAVRRERHRRDARRLRAEREDAA